MTYPTSTRFEFSIVFQKTWFVVTFICVFQTKLSVVLIILEFTLISLTILNLHYFILLMTLNGSKVPLSTTQISEIIASQSKGKIFKASGALKDSLENRLRKYGYTEGKDIPNIKRNHKPVRMTLYSITPKGRKLLKCWLGFLSSVWVCLQA
jgi:hypothetical protein